MQQTLDFDTVVVAVVGQRWESPGKIQRAVESAEGVQAVLSLDQH